MDRPDVENIEWALGQYAQVRTLCKYIQYLEGLLGESRHRLSITTEEWEGMMPCFVQKTCAVAEALREKWLPLSEAYSKSKTFDNHLDFKYRKRPLVVRVTKEEVEECLDILKSVGARPVGLNYIKKLFAILEE